jgi:predicted nucleic acid-binding protein
VLTQACALVQAYPLRAFDALHLACALAARQRLQQHGAPGLPFVAADAALLAAAAAEGFLVDHPLVYPGKSCARRVPREAAALGLA